MTGSLWGGPVVLGSAMLLLCQLAAGQASSPPEAPRRPAVWMMPSPWPGNGQCLKELVAREGEWCQTRAEVDGIGYWPALLNVHFSDAEIRALFAGVKRWRLPFAFEVPVVKPEWPTARQAFDQLQAYMKRFTPLGARVDVFSFDEPLYASTRFLKKPEAYAVDETAAYIALLRKAYPAARVCDIEPYPAVPLPEIESFVDKLQARCAAAGVKGLEMLRLDVDWHSMNNWLAGSWLEVQKLEAFCRQRGIRFSLICWAADQDALKEKGLATGLTWYVGVMHTAWAYMLVGGKPDEFMVESWVHAPEHAVPETQMDTFARSVLDLARMVRGQGAAAPPPAGRSPAP